MVSIDWLRDPKVHGVNGHSGNVLFEVYEAENGGAFLTITDFMALDEDECCGSLRQPVSLTFDKEDLVLMIARLNWAKEQMDKIR